MEENLTVDPKDFQDNKIMGILAYFGPLVLVPIFAAKESPFAKFHANQGCILCIIEVALAIFARIFGWIPIIGLLLAILAYLIILGCCVFAIIGILNANNGEMKELPLIGKFKILK